MILLTPKQTGLIDGVRSQDTSNRCHPWEGSDWKGTQESVWAAAVVLLLDLDAGFIDVLTL